MNLTTIACRATSAYTSGTVSCAVAHNLGSPLDAVSLDAFQEASKTGGVLTILVMAFVMWQDQAQKDGQN